MEWFLSLWMEIQNSEGRMKRVQRWDMSTSSFQSERDSSCAYALLSVYTPYSSAHTL